MSRSYRKPFTFVCTGADPKNGKRKTSRYIRRSVKCALHMVVCHDEEYDFYHHQDKFRGIKGGREDDWGWDYWGDGHYNVYGWNKRDEWDREWVAKLSRK